ncbi:MAG: hypothetical protein COT84_07550 [Chlamydiae bacterium CG10_big_fil_rev_8_21_14_0_10_35_9]|nr:MAG: hypothetical protein COT84_07550 [Chlamydiae bacterium CG10_big_fil_rev_8_21_14_0_10_35_9]
MTSTGHLPQILIKNAFNILGLPSTSVLREIRKRSQQLIQLAKIEEVQEFETDIGSVKEFRKENEIRLALERISGIKERLKEIFFWFEDYSVESRKVLTLISKGNYQQAVDTLKETEGTGFNWLDKKNLALALMFHAFSSSNLDSFRRSLCFWKQIVESDEFWKFYEKHYLLHDELGTVTSLFEEFRNSIYEKISEKTVSFYYLTKYPEVIGACYLAFNRIGHAVDSDILQPIILKVKKELEFLEGVQASNLEVSSAKKSLEKIHDYFCALDKFELSEYSPLIILKNDTAEKLRSISIDIYNDNSDAEIAKLFLEQCTKLALSESILEKVEADKKQILANEAWHQLELSSAIETIENLIQKEKFLEAFDECKRTDSLLIENNVDRENRIAFLLICSRLFITKAHEFVDEKSYTRSYQAFYYPYELLLNRLTLIFNGDVESQDEFVRHLKVTTKFAENCDGNDFEKILDGANGLSEQYLDEDQKDAVKLIWAAAIWRMISKRLADKNEKKSFRWVWGVIGIGFILLKSFWGDISATSSKTASTPYSLTKEEKGVISYLQKNNPKLLKEVRIEGYSDKEIAQYVLNLSDENEG